MFNYNKSAKKANNNLNYHGYENDKNITNSCFCDYCNKYYNEKLFLKNISYCVNCWSIMDSDNFDCEKLTYNSDQVSIDEVINFIKLNYEKYLKNGPQKEIENCVFNKITKAMENNKLHFLLKKELTKKVKKFVNLDNYKKFRKNRNPKINYDLSSIII